jgi:DNA-binding beta-propeller fold protein YncE
MCLFCSLTRRQVFRGLTAAAAGVGGVQAAGAGLARTGHAGAARFAALAAAAIIPTAAEAAEPVILGQGDYRYRVVEGWGELPPGYTWRDGAAVCVDSKDNVYVFNRGAHPVIVFDRDGRFLRSWGEDIGFVNAHGAAMGPDDMLYLTDDFGAAVRKCTTQGKVVMTIGTPGRPAPRFSGEPFNRCTHTALSPQGEIYVSDGYQNARVHKYAPDGKLLFSWGEPGTGPGQFNLVHNIACDDAGWVYVADRENHRVQVFDGNGKYAGQWNNLMRPCGLFVTRGNAPLAVIGELGPETVATLTSGVPNLGPRVSLVSAKGEVLARLGTQPLGEGPGQFIAPHGIAVDSRGDIYVAEVSNTYWPQLFGRKPDHELRSLQKLARVS